MKSPRTLVVDNYTALPFNLSRWFAIVGLITITSVSTASAFFLSQFLTERMLHQEGVLTMEFVQSLVLTDKSIREYFIAGNAKNSATELEAGLRHIAGMPDVLRANIYNSQRALIWSSDRDILGRKFHSNPELDDALEGKLVVHDADDFEPGPGQKEEHAHLEEADGHIIEIYVPVSDASGGTVMGAIELYKRPHALTESLQKANLFILIGAGLSGLFLYLSLFGLSRLRGAPGEKGRPSARALIVLDGHLRIRGSCPWHPRYRLFGAPRGEVARCGADALCREYPPDRATDGPGFLPQASEGNAGSAGINGCSARLVTAVRGVNPQRGASRRSRHHPPSAAT